MVAFLNLINCRSVQQDCSYVDFGISNLDQHRVYKPSSKSHTSRYVSAYGFIVAQMSNPQVTKMKV
jgi:hypothetical protein